MRIFNLFDFREKIQIMDLGASGIAETPIYKVPLEKKIAHLTAFDGDHRQIQAINNTYRSDYLGNCAVYQYFRRLN